MNTLPNDVIDYLFKVIHESNTIYLIAEYESSYTRRYPHRIHNCLSCCDCSYILTNPKNKSWGNNFIMNYRARYLCNNQSIYSIYRCGSIAQLPKNY